MPQLRHLWEMTVRPEHIDGLGHMNVRYYSLAAQRAAGRLFRDLGLASDLLESGPEVLAFPDAYIRYHREQLEGASLAVRGGVLEPGADGLRLYLELFNRDNSDVAASFVYRVELQDRGERRVQPLPAAVQARAANERVDLPDYAAPRTLGLDPVRTDVTLDEARRLGLSRSAPPVTLEEAWCDSDGFLRVGDANTLFMVIHGVRRRAAEPMRDNNFRTDEGHLMGWAMMESRQVITRLPRLGDVITCYQAETLVADKVHCSTRWVYQGESGASCAVMQTVALAFDIQERRPVSIPERQRAELMASYHPELA